MSILPFLFCLQTCVLHIVYAECIGGYPPLSGVPSAYGPLAAPYGPVSLEDRGLVTLTGSYGGAGAGDVAVIGEMPVAGSTVVAGQVPILGAVSFSGPIPAAGILSVSGSCACGARFDAPFVY